MKNQEYTYSCIFYAFFLHFSIHFSCIFYWYVESLVFLILQWWGRRDFLKLMIINRTSWSIYGKSDKVIKMTMSVTNSYTKSQTWQIRNQEAPIPTNRKTKTNSVKQMNEQPWGQKAHTKRHNMNFHIFYVALNTKKKKDDISKNFISTKIRNGRNSAIHPYVTYIWCLPERSYRFCPPPKKNHAFSGSGLLKKKGSFKTSI